MPVKGEFEITYFGGPDNPAPCGGVNYSAPYTALPPNDLAPGSVNTQNINGFLCSSPWVALNPFTTVFAAGEYLLGSFEFADESGSQDLGSSIVYRSIIVTNVKVYVGTFSAAMATQIPRQPLIVVHTWAGGEVQPLLMYPGQAVSFIQSNGIVYFTGLMLTGIFAYGALAGPGTANAFIQATGYVAGQFISELAGRLVVAECIFPTGGGTGTNVQPTVAWSGVGIFGQAWDGNPAHDVWDALNQAFFNGNIGGFNLLGDVPDQITGMGTVGQSIIIVRTNGLTQQDPNSTYSNSGIQPYNWYHMWSSTQGVGGYSGTVAQWGQALTFRSSDNVYTLSMSAGLTPVGTKIIAKIIADQRAVENAPGVNQSLNAGSLTFSFNVTFWNFASIYNLDGQLHYLLTFSAYTTDPTAAPSQQIYTCYGYDLNMSDGSFHFWDFGQYYFQSGQGSFKGFSCPVVPQKCSFTSHVGSPQTLLTLALPSFLLFGAFISYGPLSDSTGMSGTLLQLVPFNYDIASNPITNYVAALYETESSPSTTIVFRGETLSLGHKITARRLRLQTDNAPLPTVLNNSQQQAIVTFNGENSNAISPPINMNGNVAEPGLAIQTYYGDAVLSDEMVQASVTSIFSTTAAWQTLCAFRIASASLLGNDATGTTQ